MTITHQADYLLSPFQSTAIARFLEQNFAQYPTQRSYFRQIPHFRILAHDEQGQLCGHLAVEHRLVNNAGQILRVFGITDVCVHSSQRNKGLGTKLLKFAENLGQSSAIDALLLIASEPEFYLKNDFLAVENACKWLFLQGDQTLGVLNRKVGGLMVKMLSAKTWREGQLDLLGHIF